MRTIAAAGLLALAGAAAACGSSAHPNTPSAPSAPSVVSAQIVPAPTLLGVGETVALRLELKLSDGSTVVPASVGWTSVPASVLTIDSAGTATGVAPGLAQIVGVLRDPGRTASAELSVRVRRPDFTGTWIGEYRRTGCERWVTTCQPTAAEPLAVNLSQTGSQITLIVNLGPNYVRFIRAQGGFRPSGGAQLEGTSELRDAFCMSRYNVRADWNVQLAEFDDQITGTFKSTGGRLSSCYFASAPDGPIFSYEIVSLRRAAP